MINPELQKYVETSLGDNFDAVAVRHALVSAGWSPTDVDAALAAAQGPKEPHAAKLPETPVAPVKTPSGGAGTSPVAAGAGTEKIQKETSPGPPAEERAPVQQTPARAGRMPGKKLIAIGGAVVLVLIAAGGGFAFYKNGGFGAAMADTELLASLPASLETINSATYDGSLSFESQPREAGATAFNTKEYGEDPRGFGAYLVDIDDSYAFLPSEISVRVGAGGSVGKAEEEAEADGMFNAGVEISLADFNLSAEAESLKKGSDLYFRINKFPSLFIDLSALKGHWVAITPEDISSAAGSFFFNPSDIKEFMGQKDDGRKVLEQLRLLYTIAYREGTLVQSAPAVSETLDGRKTRRFRLALVKAKVPGLYERATRELQEKYGEDAIVKFDQKTADYLASDGWGNLFDYLKDNTAFEVWLDSRTGQLAKVAYSVRIVPPEEVQKLRNTQYLLQFDLALKDVNQPVTITAPADAISWDEAEVLFTGKSREQLLGERQIRNVSSIRGALDTYHDYAGAYPETLDDLLASYEELADRYPNADEYYTQSLTEAYGSRKLLESIPVNTYTKEPYAYRLEGSGFVIEYTVNVPAGMEDDYLFFRVVDGVNHATENDISTERSAQDGLETLGG